MSRTAWRVVATILAVAAVVSAVLGVRSSSPGGASTATLTTPVWSPRRMPGLIVDAVGAQHLQAALDGDVGASPTSCFVVAEGSQPVAARGPDTALIPASTEKLLTSTAALKVLGPDFKYETKTVAAAAPQAGSVARLWLVGAGDPFLATADYAAYLQTQAKTRSDVTTRLEGLADNIVAQGVKSIPGGIVGDDSRYDQQRYLPSWPTSYRTDPDIGPLGALTVNGGYHVVGGTRLVPVDDPAVYAATTLTMLLQARGVQVGPAAAHVPAPAGATAIASVTSPPLRDVLTTFLRSSDDLAGELLTKEIGVRTAAQGTTAAGVHGIGATLQTLGIPTLGLNLVDGSGLDRGNRVSCRTLASVLDLAARPEFRPIVDGLAVAGEDGTLADLQGPPLQGKLRAKTGFLNGVAGLAGLLNIGRPLRFSFLLNTDLTMIQALDARARFARILATFPQSPAPDVLVPAPAPVRR